jgi:two-component system, cell cycle sensor histidine kinase and response regulator CckA
MFTLEIRRDTAIMANAIDIPFECFFRKHDAVMLLTDGETGRLLDANDAALRFYGYSLQQITSMNIGNISQLSPGEMHAERQQAGREERTNFIEPHQLASGEIRTVEVRTSTITLADKKYFFSVIHDVTRHKQAEAELRGSEQRYRALFDGINSGVAVYEAVDNGRDFIFKDFNQAGERIDHDLRERLIGKNLLAVRPGVEKFGLVDVLRRVWHTGIPEHHPVTLYEDRQISGWYENYVYKLPSGEIVAVFENITERKQSEEALRESEERFRKIFDSASLGIVICPPSFIYEKANPAFCRMMGYSAEELKTLTFVEITHPDNIKQDLENVKKVGRGEIPFYQTEKRYIRKNGETLWGALTVSSIRDDRGEVRYYLSMVNDITERKRMEEEIQRSQKLESLGVLAGGIAHDFNNLMGGIFGYIDIASEETKEDKVAGYLAKALTTIDRARGLTQQLLTFAKGGAPVRKIDQLFPFTRETALFALSGSNVSCRFDVPEDLWPGNFDRNQIGQVIDNIIINAQQAMPGGGEIAVTARNVSLKHERHPGMPPGDYVRISIKDAGIGIPEEILPRIFDPFFTTKTKGHGLGLATCYSIVNRHGGCIEVESEPGKGSTFHVYLPAADQKVAPSAKEEAVRHIGSGTIVVMDDEEVIRETVGSMLASFGYAVVCKENGRDAIDFFVSGIKANRKIAGMILDLTVPGGMGGKDAIAEIRNHCSKTPVFVASGYAEDPVMANPKAYGFTASICKPFRKADLAAMLHKYLTRHAG